MQPEKSEDQVTLNEFIEDAFNVEQEYLMDALGDLTPEEMMWRAGPEANSIGWILWHMTRVEDMWFQFFIQRQPEIWESEGWNDTFGLPTRDNDCHSYTSPSPRDATLSRMPSSA